jgi:hypothetical protein
MSRKLGTTSCRVAVMGETKDPPKERFFGSAEINNIRVFSESRN